MRRLLPAGRPLSLERNSSDMSRVSGHISVSNLCLHGLPQWLYHVQVLDSFNFFFRDWVLIEHVHRSGLRIHSPVFADPIGHRCDQHSTDEATSEPIPWHHSPDACPDRTDKAQCKHVIKVIRSIKATIVTMASPDVNDKSVAECNQTAGKHVWNHDGLYESVEEH